MKTSTNLIAYLSLFFLFMPSDADAQQVYEKGYVITMNQDTVRGLIKEQLSTYSFDILLKKSPTAEEEVLYTPDDVQQVFFIEGQERYESHTKGVELEQHKIKVFFKHLVAGPVNLYSYVDELQQESFYIQKEELGMQELVVKTKDKYDIHLKKRFRITNEVFRGMLKLALKDCPKVYPNIEKVELFEKSLIDCVLKYYVCTGEAHWFRNLKLKKRKKVIFEFGVLGGVNFKPTILDSSFDKSRSTYPGSEFGIINRIYSTKSNYRYSFDFGISFQQRTESIDLNAKNPKTNQIFVPIRFTQYFSSNNFRPFISVGVELRGDDDSATFPFTAGVGCDVKIGKNTRLALLVNSRITEFRQANFGLVLFFL